MIQKAQIIQQFEKRIFDESYPRIFKCVNMLTEEQLWFRPNKEIPAIGNLVLHLCGNARQWIVSGIGKKTDNRERDQEFAPVGNTKKTDLLFLLENLKENLTEVLMEIEEEDLVQTYNIQGFTESGFSVIVHVIEHFSYHTGQISTLTKLFLEVDLGYYIDFNLNSRNRESQ